MSQACHICGHAEYCFTALLSDSGTESWLLVPEVPAGQAWMPVFRIRNV